ncbi:MAG: hypothetical protein SGJ10_05475 [Bacteroidota bacterium]|nr:hypothetical protein [Bacteroidota bacterium]
MKKHFKTYIILLIAAISLGTYQYIKSCGGGWYDPDGDAHNLVSQELIGETPYQPYLFTANSYLYGGNEPNIDGGINAQEWSNYLGVKITTSDLTFFTDRLFNMENAVSYFETKKFAKHDEKRQYYYDNDDSDILSNKIYKLILKNRDKKTLYYLNNLRAIEVALAQDYWDNRPIDSHKLDSLYYVIKTKTLKQKLPDYLKCRYTFLLCKLAFYTHRFERFYPAYESLKKLTNKTILLSWCRGYNAGFMRMRGSMDSASYEYSRIFVECPEIMQTAFKSFYWCKGKHGSYEAYSFGYNESESNNKNVAFENYNDFASVEKLFKTPQERANYFGLYINRSYIPACTDFLEEIIKNDPANEWVDVNLMRGIAQLEFYNSGNYIDTSLSNELVQYKIFVSKHAYHKSLKRPWLWLLGAGYLSYLSGDFEQSLKYYKEAEKLNARDSLFQNQIKLLIPLAYIKSKKQITEKEEADALAYLNNLNQVPKNLHTDDIRDELLNMLTDKYTKQNQPAKAMGIKNIYYNSENLLSQPRNLNIDSIINFIEKPSTKPYDNICKLLNKYTVSQLRLVKGSILVGQYKWKEALKELEMANDEKKYSASEDPFKNIDLPLHDYNAHGSGTSRIDFCKTMMALEQKIKSSQANEKEVLKYANGLYNISYWGNCTSLTEYGFVSNFQSYSNSKYENITNTMTNLYVYPMFDCETAKKYYLRAAYKSTNREFQAQCFFFAAICELNDYYISDHYNEGNSWDFKINLYSSNFKIMKQNYKDTKYYQDALKTCSYIDEFDKLP